MNVFEELVVAINQSRMIEPDVPNKMTLVPRFAMELCPNLGDWDDLGISEERLEWFLKLHGLTRIWDSPVSFITTYHGFKNGRHWVITLPRH